MSDLQLGAQDLDGPCSTPRDRFVGLACNTRPKEPPQLMAVGDVRAYLTSQGITNEVLFPARAVRGSRILRRFSDADQGAEMHCTETLTRTLPRALGYDGPLRRSSPPRAIARTVESGSCAARSSRLRALGPSWLRVWAALIRASACGCSSSAAA